MCESKFFELAERVNVQRFVAQRLVDNAGIDDGEAEPVILPRRWCLLVSVERIATVFNGRASRRDSLRAEGPSRCKGIAG
jgi:hypothetical protein